MLTLSGNSLPEKPLLLIIDDDALICDTLSFSLSPLFEVITSHSRLHCLQLLRQLRKTPELALVDLGLPPVPHRPDEGFSLIADLLKVAPKIRIVVLSGQSDEGNARHARTLGAVDFVAKPCSPGDLQQVLTGALTFSMVDDVRHEGSSSLLGNSPAIQKLRLQLLQYSDLQFPVLIEGESGSGKEVIASSCLHYHTKRRERPFLAINCAAISPNLVEATLFGYARGAFTGAVTMKAGYFEDAADGTLFLDEIGELALDLQAKLLRVLENGEYQRVGETQKRFSRARIIAATNRDLRKEVKAGNFRSDLYHRLSVCSIVAPPLREMGEDRLVLLDHFRDLYAAQTQQRPFSFSEEATDLWCSYSFPGNVRELRNIIIRLTTRHSGQIVDTAALAAELDLPDEPQEVAASPRSGTDAATGDAIIAAAIHRLRQRVPFNLDRLLDATERGYIEAALKLAHGNVSQAARLLGMHRTTLYNRMESSAREQ
ncbi:MAG: sigma-54-dependent Fis family transcriptional regulator [Candidatus Accumulibacter sp.]|uniref:sigma-54-dependent transcriptional regulator n=1 Tax=Candidatus Accumulibacter TaxID=327159 RepID=UPI00110A8A1C|nr:MULTISPECIES: sigma-54 dependent transcriptional regulator [Candidatus Accumulibacter]MBL8400819.1 sigma-54-dependent Fis family transcriptional regulator [Accumulibacter sp.]MBN8516926.1 sigma-54-dependent Fis family transcriptional regulator [Accumulibacter sp.]MBO3712320.1 sigma-54-dependent Fis family transcriptional regulator [Accumulibacter sp.]MCM8580323.1 sigma-54 dependent transcriptional regulator [Accumulibacter sp.]